VIPETSKRSEIRKKRLRKGGPKREDLTSEPVANIVRGVRLGRSKGKNGQLTTSLGGWEVKGPSVGDN